MSKKSWLEQLRDLLGRRAAPERAQVAQEPVELAFPFSPLGEAELARCKRAYLARLRAQYGTVHIYGLDARRRALQQSDRRLGAVALHMPLNTTWREPIEHLAKDGSPETHPLSLLQVIGRQRKVLVEGAYSAVGLAFLRFVALCLAEQVLDGEPAGLARLGPAWMHGAVFPLLVDLDQFASSPHQGETAADLLAYLAAQLGMQPGQVQHQIVEPGGTLFLLHRVEAAVAAVHDFVRRFARPDSHFILSTAQLCPEPAQEVLVDQAAWQASQGFVTVRLAPLTNEQMDRFVQQWYAELERQGWIDAESARDLPGQLCALLRRDDVAPLARHPSLLVLIALLHTLHTTLPADRGTFYQQLVNLSIASWSEGRTEQERDLRQMFDVEGIRAAVAQLIFQGIARLERHTERVELPERELRAVLTQVCRDGQLHAVNELLARMVDRSGMLQECRPGVFTLVDVALQPYVAARYLAAQENVLQTTLHLLQEDFYRWRQVAAFVVNRLARLQEDGDTALALIDGLCPSNLPAEQADSVTVQQWRLAWLSGELLLQIEPAQLAESARPVLDRVTRWLAVLLEQGRLAPYERARAGAALASLPGGDPRPGVHQVAPLLCQVVASRFWQGEGEHARLVQVDTFWISRYPVTNAQYAFFVKATGHRPPVHWKGDRFPVEMGNHPVVSVTWQDAVDFCQWLSGELRARGVFVWQQGRVERMERLPVNCRVRLPADVEWEKAARGGLLVPVSQGMGLVDNPMPRRAYPWGEAWHSSVEGEERGETRCNVSESGIGTTTPVGMYPTGASPYGVMDMAGNAWEWCLDWTDSTHRYKSRRGGAFRYTHEHAHCSAGDRAHPSLGWPYQGFRVVFGPPVEKR